MLPEPSDIRALALLDEPARRRLYEAVITATDPLSRDDAATIAGVSRALAAFHLDRLVDAGLLAAEYRRLTGRVGPGAGRPAKLYRRAAAEISVSLPDRHYDVPARVFAAAVSNGEGQVPSTKVRRAARELGESVGLEARAAAGPRPSAEELRRQLVATLAARGYAPRDLAGGEIRLGNCPFHGLVDEHRDLVCGMNLALAEGILSGLGEPTLRARLDPQPGQCCVAIGPSRTSG
jgi:predicted ArsR family transcriptional regulator